MDVHQTAFVIRRARPGDERQLAQLNQEFNGTTPSVTNVRRSMESLPEITLVAERDGWLYGFVALHVMHSFCYGQPWIELTELYVNPSQRSRGIGSALCLKAVHVAEELGAAQLWLRTSRDNEQAHRVYRRAGFEATDEIVCRRVLTSDIP